MDYSYNDENFNKEKKKIIISIITCIFIIIISLVGSYAYKLAYATNTEDVVGSVYAMTNIKSKNMGPVLDYLKDGESGIIAISNEEETVVNTETTLTIKTLSDNLKNEDFRYAILVSEDENFKNCSSVLDANYSDCKIVGEGDFVNSKEGDTFTIASNIKIPENSTMYYKFIIYIDGTKENNPNLMNNEFLAILNINDITVFEIKLDSQGAVSPGTEFIYEKYEKGIYLDYNYQKLMTSTNNPIEKPIGEKKTISFNLNYSTTDSIPNKEINLNFDGYYNNQEYKDMLINKDGYITDLFTNNYYEEDTTLYAKWIGSTITLPSPSRNGYDFVGWYTDTSFENEVTNNTPITKDMTLYAKWESDVYTIRYDANGGNNPPNTQTKKHDESLTLSNNKPTREGYTFQGWGTSKDAKVPEYQPGETYNKNESITLYAIWKVNIYLVLFDGNGGNIPNGSTITNLIKNGGAESSDISAFNHASIITIDRNNSIKYSGSYSLHANIPANAGNESVTQPVDLKNNHNYYTREMVYFDQIPSSMTGEFDLFRGSGYPEYVNISLSTIKTAQTWTKLSSIFTTNMTADAQYNFRAGYFNKDIVLNAYFDDMILFDTTNININKNLLDMVAYFDGSKSISTKEITYDAAYGSLPVPTRTGYTFDGWYTAATGGTKVTDATVVNTTGDRALYAHWKLNNYQVKYNNNCSLTSGGTMSNSSYNYGESKALTSNAYTCKGTLKYDYQGATGGNTTNNVDISQTFLGWTVGNPNILRYANFFKINGGITINNDGTLSINTTNSGTANTLSFFTFKKISNIAVNSSYVYIVDIDSITNNGGDFVFVNERDANEADQFVYTYKAISSLKVGLNYQNIMSRTDYSTAQVGVRSYIRVTPGSTTNMKFRPILIKGSYSNNALYYANSASVSNLTTAQGATINLYADWAEKKVTLPTPTRTGYTFDGWYTTATGGTKVGGGGATYVPSGANETLYARWKVNNYTVLFDGNGGSIPSGSTITNLVKNGGAESSDISAFKHSSIITIDRNNSIKYNGSYSLHANIPANSGSESVTQTVDLKNNHNYYTREMVYFDQIPSSMTGEFDLYRGSGYPEYVNISLSTIKTAKTWTRLSSIFTTNMTADAQYNFRPGYFNKDIVLNAYFDNMMLFDITNININKNLLDMLPYFDGSKSISTKAITYDAAYGSLPTPTRAGYSFDGWYTSASGGTKVTDVTVVNTTGDRILYAHWTANTYTVAYSNTCNLTKGGTMANTTHTYGTASTLRANAFTCKSTITYDYAGATGGNSTTTSTYSKAFSGWAKTSGGDKAYSNSQSVTNVIGSGTQTLYTVWTDGTAVTLPTPTKTGYTFAGWYNGSTKVGGGGATWRPAASAVTLTAHWTRNFTCAAKGSNTTYAGLTWYTVSNSNGVCELALNAKSKTSGSYNNANSLLVKEYFTSGGSSYNATLTSEKNAGLVTTIDSSSGTGAGGKPSGVYWVASETIWDTTERSAYESESNCLYQNMKNEDASGLLTCNYLDTTVHAYKLAAGARDSSYYQYNINNSQSTFTIYDGSYSKGSTSHYSTRRSTFDFPAIEGNPSNKNLSYDLTTYNTNYPNRDGSKLTIIGCGSSYHGKSTVFTPVSTTKYHYKNEVTGTDKDYNYGALKSFSYAGTATRTTANSTEYTYDYSKSDNCKEYANYTISDASISIYYRLHIKVKTT